MSKNSEPRTLGLKPEGADQKKAAA